MTIKEIDGLIKMLIRMRDLANTSLTGNINGITLTEDQISGLKADCIYYKNALIDVATSGVLQKDIFDFTLEENIETPIE